MELVKMIRNNVIRNVPVDKVALREAEGFKKVSDEAQTPSNPANNADDSGTGAEGDQAPSGGENGDQNTPPDGTKAPDAGDNTGDQTPSGDENGNTPDGDPADGKLTEEELQTKTVKELRDVAKSLNIGGYANMQKETLIGIILASQE